MSSLAERLRALSPRHLVRRLMLGVMPRRFLFDRDVGGRGVHLTFDDGPHPEHTPRLLDMLRREKALATFFVVGREAEKYPEIIRRIAADGHAIGHHSFRHTEPKHTSATALLAEVDQTAQFLASIVGTRPTLFRPPRGEVNAAKLVRLWLAGQTVVLWNTDPKDCDVRSADELARWFIEHPPQRGDVILLHDDMPHSITVLPQVIAEARARGLEFRALLPLQ